MGKEDVICMCVYMNTKCKINQKKWNLAICDYVDGFRGSYV